MNWAFTTVPQVAANNTQCEWPRGKGLGGSSAINGLYLNRPGEIEINAWQDLIAGMDDSDNWSWDAFYAAMKKSETFTPPVSSAAQTADIAFDASSHGTSGPIHYSYPGYQFAMNGEWSDAAASQGVAPSTDTYGGENWGAYVATSAINPTNWTRSYSRSGYLDPLPPRQNYDVYVNAQVTRVLFDDSSAANNMTANAVEYSTDGGATKLTVKVNKEVILAGGTVGSPTVLMYSGVGPKDVLSAAGVEVLSDLPGVGQHLQDHVSVSMQWSTDQPTAGSIYDDNGSESNDPAFLSYVNDAVAYVNSSALFGTGVDDLQSAIASQMSTYTPSSDYDATVSAGYKAIYNMTASSIIPSPIGLIELLIGNNVDGAIRIGATLQHPFSHGQITINSNDPIDYPVIDPAYLTHPSDLEILREGLKLTRRIGDAASFGNLMNEEVYPGVNVQSDDDWDTYIANNIFTEFHPSSTCAMLPLNQGGVVDANLKVYGLSNVRVADASVPPMSFSAHLMGSTYGLAEQASTIIRNSWNITPTKPKQHHPATSSTTSSAMPSKTSHAPDKGTTATPASASTSTNAAGIVLPSQSWAVVLMAVICITCHVLA